MKKCKINISFRPFRRRIYQRSHFPPLYTSLTRYFFFYTTSDNRATFDPPRGQGGSIKRSLQYTVYYSIELVVVGMSPLKCNDDRCWPLHTDYAGYTGDPHPVHSLAPVSLNKEHRRRVSRKTRIEPQPPPAFPP